MVAKRLVLAALAALGAFGAYGEARSLRWPSKPIRWIVPFPAGGPADIIARTVADKLGERIGQPNAIENRPGARGNLGHRAAARSASDGHTLLFVVPAILTNRLYMKTGVDPFVDLAPIIHLDNAPLILLVNAPFPVHSVPELISAIRARPAQVRCGASGAIPELACDMLRIFAQTDMRIVSFKGHAAALNALMDGKIDLVFEMITMAAGAVKTGRVRALAYTGRKPSPMVLADLPTMVEAVPGFDLPTWHGVMAPRHTPRDLIARINREINGVLQDPDVRNRLEQSGLEVTGGPPEAFEAVLRRDFARYQKLLSEAGIKPR